MVVPVFGEGAEPLELLRRLDRIPVVREVWLVGAPHDPLPFPVAAVCWGSEPAPDPDPPGAPGASPSAPGNEPVPTTFRWISSLRRGRAQQMNLGARAAAGDRLLFLHADSRVDADGLAELCAALDRHPEGGFAFRLAYRESNRGLRLLAALSRFVCMFSPYAFGDQGLGVSRSSFLAAGGFPDVPIFEDWLVVRRYRAEGRFRVLASRCETSGRRFLRRGIVRQVGRNAWMLFRFGTGTSLERLAEEYAGQVPAATPPARATSTACEARG